MAANARRSKDAGTSAPILHFASRSRSTCIRWGKGNRQPNIIAMNALATSRSLARLAASASARHGLCRSRVFAAPNATATATSTIRPATRAAATAAAHPIRHRSPTANATNVTIVVRRNLSGDSKSASSASAASDGVPLGKTFAAMLAGVLTVMGVSSLAEFATASDAPPFDPSGQRYDQSTFSGRFCRMLLACDPTLLLYSEESARKYGDMVVNYESLIDNPSEVGETPDTIHRVLWEAARISTASLNEGTAVPHPFRMSGYVPFNGPICVAMVASKTTPAILFWSWVNQSQNALVNYFNRNASSPMDNEVRFIVFGRDVLGWRYVCGFVCTYFVHI